jgi:hypothetical protein
LSPEERTSPVHLPFREVQETHVRLTWPESWSVAAEPRGRGLTNPIGGFSFHLVLDPESRSLSATRRFEIGTREIARGRAYAQLRELYQAAADHDAESLVLTRLP